ncbi:MAG: MerR family transcriptional regulator [Gemmatimonadetes bacterium]|nr:MerR family transcriptional regulator [Gemmatimonadota bacterium]
MESTRTPRLPGAVDGPTLRIGDLAARTDVTVETLRYYEKRGLLPAPGRRVSGYREYPEATVLLVRFIKRAQSLGFTLAEVEELVRLRARAWMGDAPHRLREATVAKVRDIDERLRQLRALRSELTALVAECDAACEDRTPLGADDPRECPLVDALDTTETQTKPRRAARRRRPR